MEHYVLLAQSTTNTRVLDPNPVLAITTAIIVGLALTGIVALWRSTAPRRPKAGGASMDLGSEHPALVDLLTGGFSVDDDAVPATVVDLAARGWLSIEEVGGGNVVIRAKSRPPTRDRQALTPYEERVKRHIEKHAVDGITPAAVLTTGPDGVSQRWFTGFAREVNKHGRSLGLCRRRWDVRHLLGLWGLVAVTWVAVGVTASTADRVSDASVWGEPATVILMICVLASAAISYLAGRLTWTDAQTDTDAGLAAAGRWLGVRSWMREQGNFAEVSAAAVPVWERHLAYATAMGLAPEVERQLPFETEHDRKAWSRATGQWRRVKVRYLARVPGWGQHPGSVAFAGLVQAVVFGFIAYAALTIARDNLDLSGLSENQRQWISLGGLIVAALAIPAVLFAMVRVILGLLDLVPRTEVTGELVRRRRLQTGHRLPKVLQWVLWSGRDQHGVDRSRNRDTRWYLAVDTGESDRILAYRCREELWRRLRQGGRVRVKVSPRLGYVSEAEQLTAPPATERAVAHDLVEDIADRAEGAISGLAGNLAGAMANLEQATDEDGRAVLDQPDDDGKTLRERMAGAQAELARFRGKGTPGDANRADGSALLGGLMGKLSDALDQATRTGTDSGRPEDPPEEQEPGR